MKLACLSGIDTIHVGMLGGYFSESEDEVKKAIAICHEHDVVPALSCGMNPDLLADSK